jgi:hypothetical protein
MKIKRHYRWIVSVALVLFSCQSVWAAFGQDLEVPKPVFKKEGNQWISELIPRGKSTLIQIKFQVEKGTLAEPAAKEFLDKEVPPNIDLKNYRSGFFIVELTPDTPGGEVSISITSDYFNSATDIWGFTDRTARTWGSIKTNIQKIADKTYKLTCLAKDGGILDEDKTVNGKIQLIIGPRDSFWGYALGTLFIRFFGVFLVLGILEIGMIISGKIFQNIEKNKAQTSAPVPSKARPIAPAAIPEKVVKKSDVEETAGNAAVAAAIAVALSLDPVGSRIQQAVPPEIAAAITVALSLEVGSDVSIADCLTLSSDPTCSWTQQGRNQSMQDRCSQLKR